MFGVTRIKNYWITDFVMKFYGKAYSSRCWNFHLLWRFYLENDLMDWAQSLGEYLELMISLRKNISSETIACLVFLQILFDEDKTMLLYFRTSAYPFTSPSMKRTGSRHDYRRQEFQRDPALDFALSCTAKIGLSGPSVLLVKLQVFFETVTVQNS